MAQRSLTPNGEEIESVIDLLSGPLWSELLAQARTLIIESRDIYTYNPQ